MGFCTRGATVEDSVKNCCNQKTVGGVSYTLVPGLPNRDTHPNHCIDGCIYHQDGTANKFCFGQGDLKVECKDERPISVDYATANAANVNGNVIGNGNGNGNCSAIYDSAQDKCVFNPDNCIKPAYALANLKQCVCACVTGTV
jgi:hypothetical protein